MARSKWKSTKAFKTEKVSWVWSVNVSLANLNPVRETRKGERLWEKNKRKEEEEIASEDSAKTINQGWHSLWSKLVENGVDALSEGANHDDWIDDELLGERAPVMGPLEPRNT